MKILAFETSAKAGSVALTDNGILLGTNYCNTGLTHSQTLMVMAEQLLQSCGLTPKDVEAVAVAAGPAALPGCASGLLPPRALPGAGKFPATVCLPWKLWRWGWAFTRALCVR